MFDQDWINYFQKESPATYYCVIAIQYLVSLMSIILSYIPYIVFLLVVISPIIMMYFGIKSIKIKLIEDKHHKRIRQQREIYENLYIDSLNKNLSKKNK